MHKQLGLKLHVPGKKSASARFGGPCRRHETALFLCCRVELVYPSITAGYDKENVKLFSSNIVPVRTWLTGEIYFD